jgi:hypothetical protein
MSTIRSLIDASAFWAARDSFAFRASSASDSWPDAGLPGWRCFDACLSERFGLPWLLILASDSFETIWHVVDNAHCGEQAELQIQRISAGYSTSLV